LAAPQPLTIDRSRFPMALQSQPGSFVEQYQTPTLIRPLAASA
jgi:hypothetical protein